MESEKPLKLSYMRFFDKISKAKREKNKEENTKALTLKTSELKENFKSNNHVIEPEDQKKSRIRLNFEQKRQENFRK